MSDETKKPHDSGGSVDEHEHQLYAPNQFDFIGQTIDYSGLEKPWYRYGHFRKLLFAIFIITLTSTNNGFDGSLLNGLQVLDNWNNKMGNPEGQILGALSNGTVFGIMLVFPIAPYLTDKFGRRPMILTGAIILIIGAVLQGLSTNYAFFLVSRLFIGFGSGISVVPSPTLISEIAYAPHRNVCTAMYNVCWYLGALIAAWVTYGTRTIVSDFSWRIPSYLQGALPLVQVVFIWVVPESPRFLVAKGRIDEARASLSRMHFGSSNDERSVRLVNAELKEIEVAIEMERIASKSSYADFIKIPSFRKRLFYCVWVAIMMQLSGNGLVSYYLTKVLDSIGITGDKRQLQINGFLMLYNLGISIGCAYATRFFKRRTIFLFSTSFMLCTYIIWTVLSAINQQRNFEDDSLASGVLAMIFLYYFGYNTGLNGLPFLYITEILPYSHRAKGMNIFQFAQQLVIVYNGFVNPIAMDAIEWKYYIVFCCVLAVELVVVYFTFVETSGYTLEEVAKVFGDDPETVLPHIQLEQKASVDHQEKISEGNTTGDSLV